jgi:hypothetical protein
MRTTLDIDDDVLAAVKARARRDNCTVGEVASDLIRSALNAPPALKSAREPKSVDGFKPLPKRGVIVTNELIDRLREVDIY